MGDFGTCSDVSKTYSAYLEYLTGPLKEDDLDFMVDATDEIKLAEYTDFDPQKMMEHLIKRASDENTSPENFHRDIKKLISIFKQMKNKNKFISADNQFTFQTLATKYGVCNDAKGPETVTFIRLTFLFPHFSMLHLMPFWHSSPTDCVIDGYCLPRILINPEFGGLIPSVGRLEEITRKVIITVHLYSLSKIQGLHLRTICVMLKKRISKSFLSDDRKVRFLLLNKVLTDGENLLKNMSEVFEKKVPIEFTSGIFWSLFD